MILHLQHVQEKGPAWSAPQPPPGGAPLWHQWTSSRIWYPGRVIQVVEFHLVRYHHLHLNASANEEHHQAVPLPMQSHCPSEWTDPKSHSDPRRQEEHSDQSGARWSRRRHRAHCNMEEGIQMLNPWQQYTRPCRVRRSSGSPMAHHLAPPAQRAPPSKPACILGDRKHIPEAQNAVESVLLH